MICISFFSEKKLEWAPTTVCLHDLHNNVAENFGSEKKNTGTETLGVFLAIYRYDPLVGNLQTHLGLVQLDQNPSMD